jgi:hypothetical protein
MNEKEKQITKVKIFITNGKIEIFEDELKTSFLKEIFKDMVEIDRKRVSYISTKLYTKASFLNN